MNMILKNQKKIRKKITSQLEIKCKYPPWFAPEKQILLLDIPKTY